MFIYVINSIFWLSYDGLTMVYGDFTRSFMVKIARRIYTF